MTVLGGPGASATRRSALSDDRQVTGGRPGAPARVLYVECNEDGTVGGSHQVLYDFVRRLDRERFEPVVLFYQANPFRDRFEDVGVEVHLYEEIRGVERRRREAGQFPAKHLDFLIAVGRRLRTIREHDVDLVHLNNSPTVGFDDWLPACRILGIPCVANAMGLVSDEYGAVQRRLMRGFDRILASSADVARSLATLGLESTVQVVPLAVDIEAFRRRADGASGDVREDLGISGETLLAIMVGHIRPWKGQHLALDAVAALPDRLRRRMTLLLVGDVSDRDDGYGEWVIRRARDEDLRGSVRYLGRREDVPRLLDAADLAIHASSEPEPFGLVVVEAMSLGKPIIAADHGGPSEIVTEGTGRLVDPTDTEAFAQTLRDLLENPEERRRLGAAARRRAEVFDIRRYVSTMENLYERILDARAG